MRDVICLENLDRRGLCKCPAHLRARRRVAIFNAMVTLALVAATAWVTRGMPW